MVTITFEADRNDSKIQQALNYLKSLGLAFRVKEETTKEEAEDEETIAVRERLRLKYVVNGEWQNMEEEDREDAVLLETMLWRREQPDPCVTVQVRYRMVLSQNWSSTCGRCRKGEFWNQDECDFKG